MNKYLEHASYWENRLQNSFDLSGTGCINLESAYNMRLYLARLRALERAFSFAGYRLLGKSVLEVGCGTGFFTEYCARNNVRAYVGIDITSISVEILRGRYPDYRFIQDDITKYDLELPSGFDLVLASDVLYHIPTDSQFENAIQNMNQVLNLGGLFIVSDVFPTDSFQSAVHVHLRSFHQYEEVLNRFGIEVVIMEPIFAVLQPSINIPRPSIFNRGYIYLWKLLSKLIMFTPIDRVLSTIIGWLNVKFLINSVGKKDPTVKLLLAKKI